jgi:hypothetical protein
MKQDLNGNERKFKTKRYMSLQVGACRILELAVTLAAFDFTAAYIRMLRHLGYRRR